MTTPPAPESISGTAPILLLCDHAANAVPEGIDLGIDPALLGNHIAIDLGAAAVTRALAARLEASAVLARYSRLVIDCNRPADHPTLIPTISDGHAIPGNIAADRALRIARFFAPYHRAVAAAVARRPALIVAVHSFTPALATGSAPRPWPVGILYNRDVRAGRLAIDLLRAAGVVTGDNEPYSGRQLNATLNRHAEANGIASFSLELRQDEIADAAGVARWTGQLTPILAEIARRVALPSAAGL